MRRSTSLNRRLWPCRIPNRLSMAPPPAIFIRHILAASKRKTYQGKRFSRGHLPVAICGSRAERCAWPSLQLWKGLRSKMVSFRFAPTEMRYMGVSVSSSSL
jgi:hypothetical protein